MEINEMKKRLKEDLTKKRYEHTLGVAYTAASLAMCYKEDVHKALLAGLLHDSAKCLSDKDKLKCVKKYKLSVTKAEKDNLELLHAKIGACFAEDIYDVHDEEILSAIRCHTTGKANMSALDEILFIADYIEPNRKELPGMDEIRYLAFHNRTDCIVMIIENTLKYLEGKKSLIDDSSKDTYDYYMKKQESERSE
ncbi:MAG: bis(5'-nucleosyl)-tetraphosphatase (symmetrical) YqeK [Lachnospiraceae bacterium]|nr:bis(5'-nucleosyl)-tetraphosphatase (symmetrical) YqeK [Lachnospiraceae bacterium]